MMHWREPVLIILAVLLGAWLVTKWPSLNVIGRYAGSPPG